MDRIGAFGGTPLAVLSNGQQGFQNQNLAAGVAGTTVVAGFLNALQEELMSLLAAAGIAPDSASYTQVLAAIQALIAEAVAGSSGLTVSVTPAGWYVIFPYTGGSMILQSGKVSLAAGTENTQQLLPTSFPTGYIDGVVSDGGAGAYSYGVSQGEDNSHIEVYCQTIQAIDGSFVTRGNVTGTYLVIGN
jgi:hypothetical protein